MEVAGQQPLMLPGTSPSFRVEEGSTSGHAGLDRHLFLFFQLRCKRQENPFVPSGSFKS